MDVAKSCRDSLNWLGQFPAHAALCAVFAFCAGGPALQAQTPSPAATGSTAKPAEGFTPGWGFGTKFEGTTSSDGTVLDLASGAGYNFSRHFGVDFGVPFYFVTTSSATKQNNPTGVSGYGLGDLGADLKWNFPGKALNYASTIHLGAPTGDKKKGFSVGHATWNWSNHFEHAWGNFTPFIDGGVGNTIADTRFFHRPFMSFGYNASFEGGLEVDAGPFSLTASAYDVAPWGTQTVYSRIFRCDKSGNCSKAGNAANRHGYRLASVLNGAASLTRDNGFNAGVEVKPRPFLDLELDYSRSVPLRLNSLSFGIAVDLSGLLRHPATRPI